MVTAAPRLIAPGPKLQSRCVKLFQHRTNALADDFVTGGDVEFESGLGACTKSKHIHRAAQAPDGVQVLVGEPQGCAAS